MARYPQCSGRAALHRACSRRKPGVVGRGGPCTAHDAHCSLHDGRAKSAAMSSQRKGRGAVAAVALAAVLGGLANMVTASRAGIVSPATKELLQSSSYIYTATMRKNGEPSASVPVWFMYDGDK